MNVLAALQGIQQRNAMVQPVLFGGENAVAAPVNELARAKALKDHWLFNYTPQDVHARTAPANPNLSGWFQGADGRWRFEMDDSAAAFDPRGIDALKAGKSVVLKDLLNHPELYKMYPSAGDITVGRETRALYNGAYDDDARKLSVNIDRPEKDALGSVLHEVQHHIQRQEGFAKGGNPGGAAIGVLGSMLADNLSDYAIMDSMTYPALGRNPTKQERGIFEEAQARVEARRREQARLIATEKLDDPEDGPDAVYRRLRGEVESRNVQTRQGLSSTNRRNSFPLSTQEFPSEGQFGYPGSPR